MQPTTQLKPASKKMLWTGRILTILVVLLLLFDCTIKILQVRAAMEGTMQLGYPASTVRPIGIILLLCTILYAIPRTSLLGAVLLTGYLGGAVASNVRLSYPLFSYTLIPVYMGVLVWAGLILRDARLRAFLRNME
ncbi:MAG TPA: DoxX family protein [Terriglobales bacterium]|jgi:hypothetical protein|nr:DoxX family protein [Terriglobales bacterium]